MIDPGISLGKFEAGSYYVEVQDTCSILSLPKLCENTFTISVVQGGPGGGLFLLSPCLEGLDDKGKPTRDKDKIKECKMVETAVGEISTDPAGLVNFLLKLVLGLSGGIAILLIIFGGYKMMTSQGNPEALQGARETITSAIVGLLFIIFSLVLLQMIGVDILKIPGLNR